MADAPTLLFVFGPPAVGKMTVGAEFCRRTGYKLLHNHLTIEPLLRLFPYDSPQFARLNDEFRTRILQEVAQSDLPGLVFSFVWNFDVLDDAMAVERYAQPFRDRGSRVLFLELAATQQARLHRNVQDSRLAEKPSKQNLQWSRQILLEMDVKHRMNSNGEFDTHADYLLIENTNLEPDTVAIKAIDVFEL